MSDTPVKAEPYPPDPYALAREAEALRAEAARLKGILEATRMALEGVCATLRALTQPGPAPPAGAGPVARGEV
jgi:hypothetical protein